MLKFLIEVFRFFFIRDSLDYETRRRLEATFSSTIFCFGIGAVCLDIIELLDPAYKINNLLLGVGVLQIPVGLGLPVVFFHKSSSESFKLAVYLGFFLFLADTIIFFAETYKRFGLMDYMHQPVPSDDVGTYLYFSVITWTTVGYGDFVPSTSSRLWASTEALLGYVAMFILISLGSDLFIKINSDPDPDLSAIRSKVEFDNIILIVAKSCAAIGSIYFSYIYYVHSIKQALFIPLSFFIGFIFFLCGSKLYHKLRFL